MAQHLILEVDTVSWMCEPLLNQTALGSIKNESLNVKTTDLPLTELAGDSNQIRLVIPPGLPESKRGPRTPDGWVKDIPAPYVTLRVMHYKGQGVARSGAGTEIARLEWIGRPLQRGEPLPIILTTNFDRPWQQDPWAWETADPVDHNDPTVRQEIFDIVHGIRADMLDGSTESLKALSAIKFAEMATIYQDYQDTADKVIDIAKDYHEAGQLELVDFTAEDLILRPCCNGRLIQVLRYDYGHWAPALGTTTPDDPDAPDPIQWPIALGRIDGTWHALR